MLLKITSGFFHAQETYSYFLDFEILSVSNNFFIYEPNLRKDQIALIILKSNINNLFLNFHCDNRKN